MVNLIEKIINKFQSFFDFTNQFNIKKVLPNEKIIKFKTNTPLARAMAKVALTKEKNTIEWIDSFENNTRFLDVGAHMGVFSLYCATMKSCDVVAIEPALANLSLLNSNIILNDLQDKIKIFPNALSNNNGLDNMFVNLPEKHQQNKVIRDLVSGHAKEPINARREKYDSYYSHSVNLLTLDELVSHCGSFNYIKIDIDGSELNLIKGSSKTLSDKSLKSILIELNEDDKDFNTITSLIENSGFKINQPLTKKSYVSNKRGQKIYNIIYDRY